MKKLILFSLFCLGSFGVFAQAGNDSLAYQLQRAKINAMLADRTTKFGQYSQSLSMHTGIFGLQTKKDIRRSNDILMDIVKTDDDIYKQLKILLDYRTFQQTQVQSHSKETEDNNLSFMTTINRLRDQVEHLKADAEKQKQQHKKSRDLFIIAFIVMLGLILWLISSKRDKRKATV
jgi:hypothetical protein